jgi:APA family basic amino acid/polyamine antiporter
MGKWWESGLTERLLRRKTLRMVAREAQLEEKHVAGAATASESAALLRSSSVERSTTIIDEDAVAIPDIGSTLVDATTRPGKSGGSEPAGAGDTKKEMGLRRELSLVDIVAYGVGCTVGAGIYSLVGEGAKTAGPAVLLSFLLGAVSCVLTGFAYSELAALIPLSGSAYTYTMVTMGELPAWLVGWNLTLEYAISAAAIARSWASYVAVIFKSAGAPLPAFVAALPLAPGWTLSPLAAGLVLACTAVLTCGVSASSRFNLVITVVNMLVLAFVVGYGSTFVDPANWTVVNDSFIPYGLSSVSSGAGVVFFSFLGFDMVSSLAEEVKSPQTTMPLGIIASLGASATVYVAVCLVVTGMAPFPEFTTPEHIDSPLSFVFEYHGAAWAAVLVAIGSVAGLTSAAFTCIMGQPRIFFRMARDGLLWQLFADVSESTGVPITGTWITGVLTALVALFMPLDVLAQAISIGTLLAFCAVSFGVIILHLEGPSWLPGSSQSASGGSGRLSAALPPAGPSLLGEWFCHSCGSKPGAGVADASSTERVGGAATDAHPLAAPPRSPAVAWCCMLYFAACMAAGFSSSLGPIQLTIPLAAVAAILLLLLCLFPRRDIPGAPFLCPAVPLVPGMAIAINSVMMAGLPVDSWLRMLVWAVVGGLVYVFYGAKHSILGDNPITAPPAAPVKVENNNTSSLNRRPPGSSLRRPHRAGYEGLSSADDHGDDEDAVVGSSDDDDDRSHDQRAATSG